MRHSKIVQIFHEQQMKKVSSLKLYSLTIRKSFTFFILKIFAFIYFFYLASGSKVQIHRRKLNGKRINCLASEYKIQSTWMAFVRMLIWTMNMRYAYTVYVCLAIETVRIKEKLEIFFLNCWTFSIVRKNVFTLTASMVNYFN